MITHLKIEGLRGIRTGQLDDLTPITILVGPNSSGKSTVLDALLLAAQPSLSSAIRSVLARRRHVPNASRWLTWGGGVEHNQAALEVSSRWRDNDYSRKRDLLLQTLVPTGGYAFACEERFWKNAEERETYRCAVEIDTSNQVSEDILRRGEDPFVRQQALSDEILLIDSLVHRLEPLSDLYSRVARLGKREDLTRFLRQAGSKLSGFQILTEAGEPELYAEFDGHVVPVSVLGEGFQELVWLMLKLTLHPQCVALIEEPESHLHPAALRSVAEALLVAARSNSQVILTTHSIEFIDALLDACDTDAETEWLSVHRLRLDPDGQLRVARTPGDEVAAARRLIEDDLR